MNDLKLSTNTAKLHQVFGKRLYANKYSFISEICQNAVDSHRMSGETSPVIVGIGYRDHQTHGKSVGNMQFYVKDCGLSFTDKEDFVAKVCTLLESGKSSAKTEDDNCAMGEHGIGTISVSAYQSQWKYTVVTTQGKKFTCTLKEIEGRGLTYELSDYTRTDDSKNVLFEVDLQLRDLANFVNNMKDKLCYFKDIQFEFDEQMMRDHAGLLTLNADFKLFQSDCFQISTISNNTQIHICLDQYSYPIKWEALGISPINLNIGLKFNMAEGLQADLTRENLQVVDNYKDIVLAKLRKVADWLVNKYNEEMEDEYTDFALLYTKLKHPDIVTINKINLNIKELYNYTDIKPKKVKFQGVSDGILKHFLDEIDRGKMYSFSYNLNNGSKQTGFYGRRAGGVQYLWDGKSMPKAMASYLKTLGNISIHVKTKTVFDSKKDDVRTWRGILQLPTKAAMRKTYFSTGVNVWRAPIEEFVKLQEGYEKMQFTLISNLVLPVLPKVKRNIRFKERVDLKKMTGQLSIKMASPSGGYTYSCKFDEKLVEVKDIATLPGLYVYGGDQQRVKLDNLFDMTRNWVNRTIQVCFITPTDQKHLEKLNPSNFMKVEDFFTGKHLEFRNIVTSYKISKEILSVTSVLNNIDLIKAHVSTEFSKDFQTLVQFESAHRNYCSNVKFMKAISDLADSASLYDPTILVTIDKIKVDINKFDYVDILAPDVRTGDKEALQMLKDLSTFRNNLKNYKYD